MLLNVTLFRGMSCSIAQDPRYLRFSLLAPTGTTHYNLRVSCFFSYSRFDAQMVGFRWGAHRLHRTFYGLSMTIFPVPRLVHRVQVGAIPVTLHVATSGVQEERGLRGGPPDIHIFSRRHSGNITSQVTDDREPSGIKKCLCTVLTCFVFLITAFSFWSNGAGTIIFSFHDGRSIHGLCAPVHTD